MRTWQHAHVVFWSMEWPGNSDDDDLTSAFNDVMSGKAGSKHEVSGSKLWVIAQETEETSDNSGPG